MAHGRQDDVIAVTASAAVAAYVIAPLKLFGSGSAWTMKTRMAILPG